MATAGAVQSESHYQQPSPSCAYFFLKISFVFTFGYSLKTVQLYYLSIHSHHFGTKIKSIFQIEPEIWFLAV